MRCLWQTDDADLAQQRFMQVDPRNRLVADALEADWNDRLRALTEAQEQYEQQSRADRALLDENPSSKFFSSRAACFIQAV